MLLYDDLILNGLTSPFTLGSSHSYRILVWQTVVFTLVGIVFVVFTTLFIVELRRAGVLKPRPTKAARLQAQVDDLQKQIDDLKKGD